MHKAEFPRKKAKFPIHHELVNKSVADKEQSHALKAPACFSTFRIFTEHEFALPRHSPASCQLTPYN